MVCWTRALVMGVCRSSAGGEMMRRTKYIPIDVICRNKNGGHRMGWEAGGDLICILLSRLVTFQSGKSSDKKVLFLTRDPTLQS